MPAPPEERGPAPSPVDGPPPVNPPIDFSDLVTQLKAHGLIEHDPITPAEAIEELDDREAEEQAAHDAGESEPGAKPTWGELFTSDEADRRFDLDFLDRVSVITSNFAKPTENQDGDTVYKLANVPDGVEADIVRFLRALLKTGATIARRYGENA